LSKKFEARKSFRLDEDTSILLGEIARHFFGKESTLIRKYVKEGALRDAERYAGETKRVLESTRILKQV